MAKTKGKLPPPSLLAMVIADLIWKDPGTGKRTSPPGVKKLHGHLSDYYRIRSGNYRIVYAISDAPPKVIVVIVSDRKDAY